MLVLSPLPRDPNPKASSGQQHPRQRLSSGGGGSLAPSPVSSCGGRAPPSVASSPAGSGGTFTGSGGRGRPLKDVIVMAACGEDEVLPTSADLPADVFTCCLTTPMPMALRWFIRQNKVCVCVGGRGVCWVLLPRSWHTAEEQNCIIGEIRKRVSKWIARVEAAMDIGNVCFVLRGRGGWGWGLFRAGAASILLCFS